MCNGGCTKSFSRNCAGYENKKLGFFLEKWGLIPGKIDKKQRICHNILNEGGMLWQEGLKTR